jgi:hypothetical protein
MIEEEKQLARVTTDDAAPTVVAQQFGVSIQALSFRLMNLRLIAATS